MGEDENGNWSIGMEWERMGMGVLEWDENESIGMGKRMKMEINMRVEMKL
jgi:hypothetical protein